MTIRSFDNLFTRRTLSLILFLSSFCVLGCETDGYPEDMVYPARTDPLVINKPERDAPAIDRPGEYPKILFVGLTETERDKLLLEPDKVDAGLRDQLEKQLDKMFGTPAHPKVEGEGDELKVLKGVYKLDEANLARGAQLYRQQCLHCHGLTGDGRGPTAPWVNAHPRDYRMGKFKFTSSKQPEGSRKPRKEDLVRTIYEGIEGSSMPSFRLLGTDDIETLAAYVVHLSLRGELEYTVLRYATPDINDYFANIAKDWVNAEKDGLIVPDAYPPATMTEEQKKQSVINGMKLFTQQGGAGCISCHTDFGRQSAYKYDVWGTITRPVDLTTGIYHGGRRPIDLFWRIHSGINGSGMTAFSGQVSSKDIWDIVAFLQVLPYPAMRDKFGIKLENN